VATIVLRKDGRAEIRESYTTPRGPRSRTLAVFRELTDRVLEKAERRASRPFSRARILARARQLGVPRFGESAARSARVLLAELQVGRPLAPTLVTALLDALASRPARELPPSIGPLLPWLTASDEERGEALRERMHPAHRGVPTRRTLADFGKETRRDEKVALLARSFERANVPYAFGGGLALGYYTTPEEAEAIELWVFEPVEQIGLALTSLEKLGVGVERSRDTAKLGEAGTATLEWERTPVELYCSYDAYHDARQLRIRQVPFGEDSIWILSAEDLVVFTTVAGLVGAQKTLPPELEQLLFARVGDLDLLYVRDWLDRILGPDDPRRRQFEEIARRMLGDDYLFYGTTVRCEIASARAGLVISQVLALAGEIELPDAHTEAFDRLARWGVAEGPALVKKAPVRDSSARVSGLEAGTYTLVASGYELADPRSRVMQSHVLDLEPGVEEVSVRFRF
jgi:hypothetical protein